MNMIDDIVSAYESLLRKFGVAPNGVMLTRYEFGEIVSSRYGDSLIDNYSKKGKTLFMGMTVVFVCNPVKNKVFIFDDEEAERES